MQQQNAFQKTSSTNRVNTGLTFQHYLPGLLLRKKDKRGKKKYCLLRMFIFQAILLLSRAFTPKQQLPFCFGFFFFDLCLFSSSSAVLLMRLIICVIHFSRCN